MSHPNTANSNRPSHHLTEAIILAGGLGTRLRSAVPDLPKCMAPVNGKPFLGYIIQSLQLQGVTRFIFSLGYLHETIEVYLKNAFPTLAYEIVIEDTPLGTGGAIQLACSKAQQPNVLVTNGDTFFDIEVAELSDMHLQKGSACTLCLKPMQQFDRYGVVTTNSDGRITSFKEKQWYNEGLINGGVYALNVAALLQSKMPETFSFEKAFLEACFHSLQMYAIVQNGYFIDIGIPEDYLKAQTDFL